MTMNSDRVVVVTIVILSCHNNRKTTAETRDNQSRNEVHAHNSSRCNDIRKLPAPHFPPPPTTRADFGMSKGC